MKYSNDNTDRAFKDSRIGQLKNFDGGVRRYSTVEEKNTMPNSSSRKHTKSVGWDLSQKAKGF